MSLQPSEAGLFGLEPSRCNRDFAKGTSWGKNKFNSSFPAALACYMASKSLMPVYLRLDSSSKIVHTKITTSELFGLEPFSTDLYFSFESDYTPYRTIATGGIPRTDLVTLNTSEIPSCLRCLEVKLTALPDNSTYRLSDEKYGCEIVVRPVTIVYLALSIAYKFKNSRELLLTYLEPVCHDMDTWSDMTVIVSRVLALADALDHLLTTHLHLQTPLVLQPIWKTIGRTFKLCDQCLDIFVWSDFAFTRLFFDVTRGTTRGLQSVGRPARSLVWLAKMLYDFAQTGKIPYLDIIRTLSFNAQTDKAFALNGANTNKYMVCEELVNPRIQKSEIKDIVLGGGQNFLSPERRFDAALLNDLNIFE
jgi:HindVP restriction endonuclease